MDDVVTVEVLEGEANLNKDGEDGLLGEGFAGPGSSLFDFHGEVAAVDVFCDEVEAAELGEGFDVGEDAGVGAGCEDSHFVNGFSERRRFWFSVDDFANVGFVCWELRAC